MSDLHQEQLSHLADIAGTYSADPDDPTSLEVLLVLQETCHILEISHSEMVSIFGKRTLPTLRTWGKHGDDAAASHGPRRVWIWWPNAPRPVLCKSLDDGTIARMTDSTARPPA